ncbi:MAG: metal-dependent hydrolase [Burkholderiales bacterium]
MPSILTHPAVPLALGLALGRHAVPRPWMPAGAALSVLPDVDVLAFAVGIPYAHPFGHRGVTHSVVFALVMAVGVVIALRHRCDAPLRAFPYLAICALSHGVLDAFTTGGLGIAFLWPVSDARFLAPVRVIEVSPIGVSRFLSGTGARVLLSEALWVWLPALALAAAGAAWRRRSARVPRL